MSGSGQGWVAPRWFRHGQYFPNNCALCPLLNLAISQAMRLRYEKGEPMTLTKSLSPAVAIAMTAALLVGGCSAEPGTYSMSSEAVKSKLTGAQKQYIEGGQNTRTVRATGWSGNDLNVRISTSVGSNYTQNCKAKVEAIDEDTTRVTPDCGEGINAGNNTILELLELEVDEFIIAALNDSEMDGDRILMRGAAVTLNNMGDMQREALAADQQFRETGTLVPEEGGWAEERRSSLNADAPADDWGN